MKFKDFKAPVLFSSTFKALNLAEKNSRTFKDAWEPCIQPEIYLFFFLPLPFPSNYNTARQSGECCKLPHWGLGFDG